MANGGVFRIYEIDPDLGEEAVRFEWDSAHQSSPRNSWEFATSMRTHREDYAGSEFPTEQILGPQFDEFDVEGLWEDKYNYSGFAWAQQIALEDLVRRGNRVRLEFEEIQITGIIKKFTPTYFRKIKIGYKITFSPHYRKPPAPLSLFTPEANTPHSYAKEAYDRAQKMNTRHLAAPLFLFPSDLVQGIGDICTKVLSQAIDAVQLLESPLNLVRTADTITSDNARLAQSFFDMQKQAFKLPPQLASVSTANALAYLKAVHALELITWSTDLAFQARQLARQCFLAQRSIAALVDSEAIAVYRPYRGESLYAISNRFYRTPHNWQAIYERNRLRYITMSGTEALIIPKVT